MRRDWPGNARELRNAADRFVLGFLGDDATAGGARQASLPAMLDEIEREIIAEALRVSGDEIAAAALALGVPRKTLADKIRRLGLVRPGLPER